MTQRTDTLLQDLDGVLREWAFSDEGRILVSPTKADMTVVQGESEEAPLDDLLQEAAVVIGDFLCARIGQLGLRPADYWKTEAAANVTKRLAKALSSPSPEFLSLVQGILRGRG